MTSQRPRNRVASFFGLRTPAAQDPGSDNDLAKYWYAGDAPLWTRLVAFAALVVGVLLAVLLDLGTIVGVVLTLLLIVASQWVGLVVRGRRRGDLPPT